MWGIIALVGACICIPADPVRGQRVGGECPFEIEGIWKPQVTAEADPVLLRFAKDGWVSLLQGGAQSRAQDFDVVTQVNYRLDTSQGAPRLLFESRKGNDVFPPGTSSWDVIASSDTTFSTVDPTSGERTDWERVQTHRYFLTFAARSDVRTRNDLVLLMWTSFDGRGTDLEALGVSGGRDRAAVFGRIPAALAAEFAADRRDESRVMLRLEMSEPEYRRTHAVFAAWDRRLKSRKPLTADPQQLASEFVDETIQAFNRCNLVVELPRSSTAATTATGEGDALQRLVTFVRQLKATNANRHVTDDQFSAPLQP